MRHARRYARFADATTFTLTPLRAPQAMRAADMPPFTPSDYAIDAIFPLRRRLLIVIIDYFLSLFSLLFRHYFRY
jgi:hypothetical protein